MNKIVRKVRPADYWRIGERESWLSDMAAQGLHLNKMGTYFAHFKRGEPKRMEYRIEVTKNKRISNEQITLYEENGWHYVTSYQYFHVFTSPEENHAPELHTDPAEQSYTLNQLNKILIVNFLAMALALIIIIGMLAALWFLDGTPTLQLVKGYVIQQTMISLIILCYVYYSSRAMLSIQALRTRLKEGKAINHHAPWAKRQRKNTIFSILFVGVALACSTLPFIQLIKNETKSLPEVSSDLPIVRLADVEENPTLIRDVEYMRDGVDWSNNYSYNWNIFAPVQYESNENGTVPNRMWKDSSDTYSPSIQSSIYELRVPSLAKPVVYDLIKWHSYGEEVEPYYEIKNAAFDLLIVQEEAEIKKIYASKGKAVMFVRYYGYAEIDTLIESIAHKLTLISGK